MEIKINADEEMQKKMTEECNRVFDGEKFKSAVAVEIEDFFKENPSVSSPGKSSEFSTMVRHCMYDKIKPMVEDYINEHWEEWTKDHGADVDAEVKKDLNDLLQSFHWIILRGVKNQIDRMELFINKQP